MRKRIISLWIVLCMLAAIMPVTAVQAQVSIKIGDYVQMGTYYGEPILWRCVSFEKIKGYDDEGNPIMDSTDTITEYKDGYLPLMLSDKILCMKAFDAAGEDWNSSHGRGWSNSAYYQHSWRGINGSNYWSESNIRDWLNSMASDGNVQWSCGNPPIEEMLHWGIEYSTEAGFMTGFTNDEYTAIKHVIQKSVLDPCDLEFAVEGNIRYNGKDTYKEAYSEYVEDSCFLLDVQQVENIISNIPFLGYNILYAMPTNQCILKYKNSEYYQAVVHNGGDGYTLSENEEYPYWLRSVSAFCDSGQKNVAVDKKNINDSDEFVRMSDYFSNSGYIGVRPALFLSEKTSFVTGDGTEATPYTVDGGGSADVGVTAEPTAEPTPQSSTLKVYSNAPSLSATVGDSVIIGAAVTDENRNAGSSQGISFDTDDNVLKAIKTLDDGNARYITFVAQKASSTLIKIKDSATGQTAKLPFTVNKAGGNAYTIYNVPNLNDDKANFNNFAGLYIDKFDVEKKRNGDAEISFDAYNQNPICGAVEVYDADGELIDAEVIDKTAFETNIASVWGTVTEIGKDISEGIYNPLDYRSSIQSKKSEIRGLSVPAGGYIKISTDPRESSVCGTINALDMISQTSGLISNAAKKEELPKTVTEKLKKLGKDFADEYQNKFSMDLVNKNIYSKKGLTEFLCALANMFSSGEMRELAVSALSDSAVGVAESAVMDWLKQANNPAQAALDTFWKISKANNLIYQASMFGLRANSGSITIQVPEGDYRKCSDVTVKCAMNDNTAVDVLRIDKNSPIMLAVKKANNEMFGSSQIIGYDISLVENGELVQPQGTAKVMIDIPKSLQEGKNIAVYRADEDGNVVNMNGKTADGRITFETEHFSTYILAADDVPVELPKTEEGQTVVNGDTVVSEWAAEEVKEAFDKQLVPEILKGENLTKKVDRAEFAAIAVNLYEKLSGNTAQATENPFGDISGSYCENEILKAYNLGVTNGTTDITFEPSALISREQVATMLTRAYKKSEFSGWTLATDGDYPLNYMGVTKYADDAEISDYAKESVYFMTRWDILNGVDDTHFAPKNNVTHGESYGYATREQAVVIALRSAKHL